MCVVVFGVLLGGLAARPAAGADLDDCRTLLLEGKYEACIAAADEAIGDNVFNEEWWRLKVDALAALGRNREAAAVVEHGLRRFYRSLRLRLAGHDVLRRTGDIARAQRHLERINALVNAEAWRYRSPDDLIALGRVALRLGADARQILELFYDRVKKARPDFRDAYIAAGELALGKHDYATAAEEFQAGLKQFPDDPDLHFGLARAFAPSDAKQTQAALLATLTRNPRHTGAMLLKVDNLVDAEQYEGALAVLTDVLAINPRHPTAWAYKAVLAHLDNRPEDERFYREYALCDWRHDPAVDHLIGRKLAQKYRFAEGAAYQRQALSFDRDYLPAKIQLAQDLLRLGREEEGWRLAEAVHQSDGYDVTAYNLVTLEDTMALFRTLEDDEFLVRMGPHEAEVYGQRVVDLLHRARDVLCRKYGFDPIEKVTVEIFPEQKDFAVRTFGMPGGAGFLGVCFGNVITANSPASQGDSPSNWEAVLWHEFCHVVTLGLTRNKMPRWLSEGISVYEERQADPSWGQGMTPQYREMVLGDELTPVGELSAAFLSPPSPAHLQFAYYESSLVVEFIVDRFGIDALRRVLHALANGEPINAALEHHVARLDQLEKDFAAFARTRAEAMAPAADWEKPDLPERDAGAALAAWVKAHPDNFPGLLAFAAKLVAEKKWAEAKPHLERLLELHPDYAEADNAYAMLALVHRNLNDTDAERAVLETLVSKDADAIDALLRLLDLTSAAGEWRAVVRHAEHLLAVNPLLPAGHRHLARAAEALGEGERAVAAYRTILALDPADPAQVHYRLAHWLHETGAAGAKRQVLMALEEAPRFRAAQRLLLELTRSDETGSRNPKSEDTAP